MNTYNANFEFTKKSVAKNISIKFKIKTNQ